MRSLFADTPSVFQSRKRLPVGTQATAPVPEPRYPPCIHGDGLPPSSPLPSSDPSSPSPSTPSGYISDHNGNSTDTAHPRSQRPHGRTHTRSSTTHATPYTRPATRSLTSSLNTPRKLRSAGPAETTLLEPKLHYRHKPPAQRRIIVPPPVLPPLRVIQNAKGLDYVRLCRHTCINGCKPAGYRDGKSSGYYTHIRKAHLHLTCTPLCPMFTFVDDPSVLTINAVSADALTASTPIEVKAIDDPITSLASPPLLIALESPAILHVTRIMLVLDPSNRRLSARATSDETAWYKIDVPEDEAHRLLIPEYRGYVFDVTPHHVRHSGKRTLSIMEMVRPQNLSSLRSANSSAGRCDASSGSRNL